MPGSRFMPAFFAPSLRRARGSRPTARLAAIQARRLAMATAVAGLALLRPSFAAPSRPARVALPQVMLWAWERPEDLRDVGPGVGVAFLAQTLTIASHRIAVEPRRQPLRVPPHIALVAVTRIEVVPPLDRALDAGTSLRAADIDEAALLIADTAALPPVAGVQVDFDAAASARLFYRELLRRLRDRLDPRTPLSITALASWCSGDDWLSGLPVDETVPMLFRMGPINEPYRRIALSGSGARPECLQALGTSLDEPIAIHAGGRRVYVFNPKPWTAATIAEAARQLQR